MYNLRQRSPESIDLLRITISHEWNTTIFAFQEAPRGFYGETWDIESDKGRFIAKLDITPHHRLYRANLPILQGLLDQKIPNIVQLIKTKRESLFVDFEGGTLALFGFVPGAHTEDYPIERLFRTLAEVYHAVPPQGIRREAFGVGILDIFDDQVSALGNDHISKRVAALIREKEPLLAFYRDRLKAFSDQCEGDHEGFFVTHGDAGGNAILTDLSFTLIDWDQVMYAPPERDAWFFIADPHFFQFDLCLREAGHRYQLRNERIGYYGYYTYFFYLHEYLTLFHSIGDEEILLRCAKTMESYFNSWIVRQMKVLETDCRFI